MMSKNQNFTWFDFSRWGGPSEYAVTALERDLIWQGAQHVVRGARLNERTAYATREMMRLIENRLLRQSQQQFLDSNWYANALLITALEGELDGILPPVIPAPV